jgi:nitrogenase molybdenum-iron protein alpha/beta subunit
MSAGARPAAAPADWSDRVSFSFTIGVYLAVNAVPDLYLIVDAPDCAHLKTQYVQGNHDWFSTLTNISGIHRVANTDLHPWKMVPARDDDVEAILAQLASYPGAGAVMITSMPMATITGLDYDRLDRKVSAASGKPIMNVPGNALSGDWLDGYAGALKALARAIDLGAPQPTPGTVAVVGYLMDRSEGDHRGNLAELRRLLGALDLRVAPTWLAGETVAELARVREAEAIIALPYGREAATILGERLGVPVIDAGLPFGLGGTERWLRAVASATGRADRVEALLEREIGAAMSLIEWAIPYHLVHRTLVFFGDPHLGLAVDDLAREVGLRPERHFIFGRRAHARELLARYPDGQVVIDPKRNTLDRGLLELASAGRADVFVTNSMGMTPLMTRSAIVELGYPSFFTHALTERPFLFFRGFLATVERIINELRRAEFFGGAAR